ncbi:MAG: glycosyltransferase family 4 protein [Sneathiellales bacterium]|nr:glycosyltransferase family 4 protein [Sneathiellales bacterium]
MKHGVSPSKKGPFDIVVRKIRQLTHAFAPETRIKKINALNQQVLKLEHTNTQLNNRVADLEKRRLALLKRIDGLEEKRQELVDNYNEVRRRQHSPLWSRHLKKTFDFALFSIEEIADGEVSLCVAHDTYSLQAAELFKEKFGARILYDAVEVPNYQDRSIAAQKGYAANIHAADFVRTAEYELIRKADSLISVSEGLAQVVEEQTGAKRPTVVRNCRFFETAEDCSSIREDAKCTAEDKVVLFLNTINYGDGLDQAIEALKELPETIKFVFLGGVQKLEGGKNLNVELRKAGLFDRCAFVEAREPHELIQYISGADIMAIMRRPTNLNNEISLPNRVFEAISAEIPLVVPDLRDIGKIVSDHDIGEVYAARDPFDMVRKIKEALDTDRHGELKKSLIKAKETLCWEKEQVSFLQAVNMALQGSQSTKGRTVILACKGLERNDRIFRMSKTLLENGHDVHVVCLELPKDELFHAEVGYHKFVQPEAQKIEEDRQEKVPSLNDQSSLLNDEQVKF